MMTRRRTIKSVDDGNEPFAEPAFGRDDDWEDGDETASSDQAETLAEEYAEPDQGWLEDEPKRPRGIWIMPTLAILVVLGWTGFFGWANRSQILAGASGEQWTQWIATWAMPVLLVIGLWLLAMRNSRREANRFTDAARALAHESAQLEARLTSVNRELSLAREFIASQSRDLESLGRVATERLSENADHLQSLIRDNSAQVEAIGTVSDNALANMQNMRDQLPVLSNAARDMSNQIGNAGNVARQQVDALVDGFVRLNQFGEAGEKHVDLIGEKVRATLDSFDRQVAALGEVTQTRFTRLREVSEAFRTDLVESEDAALASLTQRADELAATFESRNAAQREAEEIAVAAMRNQLATLSDEGTQLLATMGEGRQELQSEWAAAVEALEARMAEAIDHVSSADERAMEAAQQRLTALSDEAAQVDERIAASLSIFDDRLDRRRNDVREGEVAEIQEMENRISAFEKRILQRREDYSLVIETLARRSEELFERLAEVDTNINRLNSLGDDAHTNLGAAAAEFSNRLADGRAALEENSSKVARLTDDGVRLLEIIRASAEHSEGALANAIGTAEARLSTFGDEAARLSQLVTEAEGSGEALSRHIQSAQGDSTSTIEQLRTLEAQIGTINAASEKLAERAGGELREAIELLGGSTTQALEGLRENQREIVEDIAGTIAGQSRERIAEAIREDAAATIAELEAAVAQAAERGRTTTIALRDQLAMVNELTGNLEQRISYARERAEEKIDTDFSRRIALITEALNSSAIDISKAFENEVSDTQWSHYLRGDRGIFTRRAVRLLDRQESRAVVEIYGEDSEFRETVNRYIHDFEAMLREVLSTRDGNALAVTLLSSDAGKLYVAMAQAIDRLRD